MAISLREACNCIGLTGNISIIGDFYGYNSVPEPYAGTPGTDPGAPGIETLSLLQQVRLIKNNSHIRLHVKIEAPAGTIFNPTIDQQVSAMRQVYASIGIAVLVRSVETLALPASFFDIQVDYCTAASSEMINLFQNLKNVPTKTFHFERPSAPHNVTDSINSTEIVVYFVSTVTRFAAPGTSGAVNGCAAYPNGAIIESIWEPDPRGGGDAVGFRNKQKLLTIPGAVIASNSSVWTLAHEVGHVLGLDHVDNINSCLPNSLMTSCSTNTITNPPPDLSSSEVATVVVTGLNLHFFKKCGDP